MYMLHNISFFDGGLIEWIGRVRLFVCSQGRAKA